MIFGCCEDSLGKGVALGSPPEAPLIPMWVPTPPTLAAQESSPNPASSSRSAGRPQTGPAGLAPSPLRAPPSPTAGAHGVARA